MMRFEDLHCWQTARTLTKALYEITNQGPFGRDFGLRDQIRRAAVSVMSNIAEGYESRTRNLFIEFLGRAKGSAGEVRCQLYIARDVEHLTPAQFDELYDQSDKVIRQISNLMHRLQNQTDDSRIHDDPGLYL